MTPSHSHWASIHIFLSDPEKNEAFIVSYLSSFARDLVKSGQAKYWFYMRYWEGGPHIRFRFLTDNEQSAQTAIEAIRADIVPWKGKEALDKETYYAHHTFDGETIALDDLPWYPDGCVEAISYQPEIQRYGGEEAILASEKLFSLSSNIALALTKATQDNLAKRYSLALSMMLTTICGYRCDLTVITGFFSAYAGYWQQYSEQTKVLAEQEMANSQVEPAHIALVQSTVARSRANMNTNDPQSVWCRGIKSFVRELTEFRLKGQLCSPMDGLVVESASEGEGAILNILSSQMHMLNNRLGLTPSQELLLSLKIAKAANALHQHDDNQEKEQAYENTHLA